MKFSCMNQTAQYLLLCPHSPIHVNIGHSGRLVLLILCVILGHTVSKLSLVILAAAKFCRLVNLTSCFPKSPEEPCQKHLYTDCGLSSLQIVLGSPDISNLELQNSSCWWLWRPRVKWNAKCLQHDKTRYLRLGMLQYGPDYLPSFLHRTERTKFANFKNGYDLVTMDPQYFVPSFGPNVSVWVSIFLPILRWLNSNVTTMSFSPMSTLWNENDHTHCDVQHLS